MEKWGGGEENLLVIGQIRLMESLLQVVLFRVFASGHDSVLPRLHQHVFSDVLWRTALGPSQTLASHLRDPPLPPKLLQLLLSDSAPVIMQRVPWPHWPSGGEATEHGWRDLCFLPLFGPR